MKYAVKLTTKGTGRSAKHATTPPRRTPRRTPSCRRRPSPSAPSAARAATDTSARPAPSVTTATSSGPSMPHSTSAMPSVPRGLRRSRPTLAATSHDTGRLTGRPSHRAASLPPDRLRQLVESDDDAEQQTRQAGTRATCPATHRARTRRRRAAGSRQSACSRRLRPDRICGCSPETRPAIFEGWSRSSRALLQSRVYDRQCPFRASVVSPRVSPVKPGLAPRPSPLGTKQQEYSVPCEKLHQAGRARPNLAAATCSATAARRARASGPTTSANSNSGRGYTPSTSVAATATRQRQRQRRTRHRLRPGRLLLQIHEDDDAQVVVERHGAVQHADDRQPDVALTRSPRRTARTCP